MSGSADPGQSQRVNAIVEAVEAERRKAEDAKQHFTLPPDTRGKLTRRNEPLIVWQAWNPTTPPGRVLVCSVGIANPTAQKRTALFVHFFVGTANIVDATGSPSASLGSGGRDLRFSQLTMPRYPGASLEPGQTERLSFGLVITEAAERSNYLGNALLFATTWHDPGRLLDRSLFVFEVG